MKPILAMTLALAIGLLVACGAGEGGNAPSSSNGGNSGGGASSGAQSGTFAGNVVLGSPTADAVLANVYAVNQSGTVYISYGRSSGNYEWQTEVAALKADVALELRLANLAPDTQYFYRVYFSAADKTSVEQSPEYRFHTARGAGSAYVFTIQGDSHPERENTQFNAELYRRTLNTALADQPDFHIAMGDDFSVDTLDATTVSAAAVRGRYTLQRPYLGVIGASAPVFLVNGNHEQAARYLLNGTANNVAVWAQTARNSLYSQPEPDAFYSGNPEQVPFIGLLRNTYAWTWGDALFVVIDPYWSSPDCVDAPFAGGSKRSNLWDVTLGDAQYQWLKTTLEGSQAKYKFVFAHHVMGTGRGGIELASLYEWGGYSANGTWGFTANRPLWSAPLHQLMVANKVTIFFQGHDHIWATQRLDGVVYQTLPEPADPNYALFNADAYLSGDKLPNTGYARISVGPAAVKVDYVRTYLPADEMGGKVSGSVAYSYAIPATR